MLTSHPQSGCFLCFLLGLQQAYHSAANADKLALWASPPQPGEIHCRTLPDILREHDMPRVIDWLSLDVERAELEILDSQQISSLLSIVLEQR